MSDIKVLVIDLSKSNFHVIGHKKTGKIIFKKAFSRTVLVSYISNLPTCIVAMESCPGYQRLGRKTKTFGHDTRLLPA
jgi:transposase